MAYWPMDLRHMTHLRADHQLGDTVHHGDGCCGDGSLLVPICALQPEKDKKRWCESRALSIS